MNWLILLCFFLLMHRIAPSLRRKNRQAQFFRAETPEGQEIGFKTLTSSLLISWIFAKSIYNATDLGAALGAPGGLAYAVYWLSFLVAGWTIYRLRQRGFGSLHEFLKAQYGRAAVGLFSLILIFRLWNEIWSNTMVVGLFFGEKGSSSFIWATWVTTFLVLAYTLKSGLFSSVKTDVLQMVLAVTLLGVVLSWILPRQDLPQLMHSGQWTLAGGVDLLLVALIQIWSYPFHDPVMTDRGFITRKEQMLKSFVSAGVLGMILIFLFSGIGIFHGLEGQTGQPLLQTAQVFGLPLLLVMNALLLSCAASTIDSTLSAVGKLTAIDLFPKVSFDKVQLARLTMIYLAILGNLMVHAAPRLLNATTVGGTMVIGLAPVFIFARWKRAGKVSFFSSVLIGLIFGIALALKWIPGQIGTGTYGVLLYANVVGSILSFGFFIGGAYFFPRKVPASQPADPRAFQLNAQSRALGPV